jgi:hypothetical protein
MPELSSDVLHKTVVIDGTTYPVIVCPRGTTARIPQKRLAPKREAVRVYYPNCDRPEPWRVEYKVAKEWVRQGLANWINRKLDIRLKSKCTLQPSSATIRYSESLTNAGLHGPSKTMHLSEKEKRERFLAMGEFEDFIEKAEAKVMLWPLVCDTKAVRVGPAPLDESIRFAAYLERVAVLE